jgi:formylmethanofuran:tetrahydromethanopterin formyltransferase
LLFIIRVGAGGALQHVEMGAQHRNVPVEMAKVAIGARLHDGTFHYRKHKLGKRLAVDVLTKPFTSSFEATLYRP